MLNVYFKRYSLVGYGGLCNLESLTIHLDSEWLKEDDDSQISGLRPVPDRSLLD